MKRFVLSIMCFVFGFFLFTETTSFAAASSGTCGYNVKWSLSSSGALVISGSGEMYDYSRDYSSGGKVVPWGRSIKSITINNGVRTIGDNAFYGCSEVTSVSIPSSVTRIGDYAFYDCKLLQCRGSLLSSNLTYIGKYAFYNCSALNTSLELHGFLTEIGDNAFRNCANISSIKVFTNKNGGALSAFKSIGNYSFRGCTGLQSFEYVDNITYYCLQSIGNGAFDGCENLTSISFPLSLTSLGSSAFYNCINLEEVSFQHRNDNYSGLSVINEQTFYGCKSLKSLVLQKNVKQIKPYAFYGCNSLEQITLPDSLEYIFDSCFEGCNSLEVALPDQLTYIGSRAFAECYGIIELIFPETMMLLGQDAFAGCMNLAKVTFLSNISSMASAFSGCNLLKSAGPIGSGSDIEFEWNYISSSAFQCCSELETVLLPDNCSYIGPEAFAECYKLRRVIIPNTVEEIGYNAFSDCNNLEYVFIPNGVKELGTNIFSGCAKLISAGPLGSGNAIEFGWEDNIPSYAFDGANLTSVDLPEGLTIIGESAFAGNSLRNIILPDSLQVIEKTAFEGSKELTEITIPRNVSFIGEWFCLACPNLYAINVASDNKYFCSLDGVLFNKSCNELIDVPEAFEGQEGVYDIPGIVTAIHHHAFFWCVNLHKITIPGSVTEIGESAFSCCSGLSDIILNEGVSSIPDNAFSSCNGLKRVILPQSVNHIGQHAFSGCNSLISVCILSSELSIDQAAFYYCSALSDVSLCGDMPSMNESAFYPIEATIYYPANNSTYSTNNMLDYGGHLTWVAVPSIEQNDIFYLPNNLKVIDNEAFMNIKVSQVNIPQNVEIIGASAFANSDSMRIICFEGSPSSIEDDIVANCKNVIVFCHIDSSADTWARQQGLHVVHY